MNSRSLWSAVAAVFALAAARTQDAGANVSAPPRLVVLCSIDQLASWVFQRGEPFLAKDGGFRRLQQHGAWFPQCAYRQACTETGPGHATIGTGALPSAHGIGRNDWWSPQLGRVVYCAEDEVAPLPEYPEGKNRGPAHLLAPTLASTVKAHIAGSKVASIAWKDRSAILMAGQAADVAAWIDTSTGNLVTNTAWCKQAPEWLLAFNRERPIDRAFGSTWTREADDAAFAGLVDDRPFEVVHPNGERQRTLPQKLTGGLDKPGSAYWSQVYGSPVGNTVVRLAAEAAVQGLQLGADAVPDVLCVSFSSTDVIGHMFGPDSVESRDALLKLDRELGQFFAFLDQRVGAGQWAMFLTADHGVAPTPEQAKANGVDAGRGLIHTFVRAAAEKALADRFGPPPQGKHYLASVADCACFFDEAVLHGVRSSDVASTRREAVLLVAQAARKVRGVMMAMPTEDVLRPRANVDALQTLLANAMCDGRSGDVQFVLQPYWIEGTTPATHGSPHPYDREVVGFAYGPGVPAGSRFADAITPGFGAVLLSRMLGVPPPAAAIDAVPPGLLGTR